LESWQQSSRLYRFSELLDHLNNKHPEIHYQYCSICEEMIREDDWSEDQSQLFDKHFQEEHLNNNAGFDLRIQSP
jgi:predicted Rdx family selenoprotein